MHTLVRLKASLMLLNTFGTNGCEAHMKVVMFFMRKPNYVYCNKTNEAMRAPQEVCDELREFLEFTCLLLLGLHHDWRFILPTTAQRLLKSVAPRQFTSARQGTGQRGQQGHLPSRLLEIFDANDHLQRYALWVYYTNRTAKF
jgi:hypothetical protein